MADFVESEIEQGKIEPPRPAEKSFTILKAQALRTFSRTIGSLTAVIAIATQSGALAFLPKEYEKPVSAGMILVGVAAMMLGNEKQGKAIIDERLSKNNLWTPTGKDGPNKQDALYTGFFSAAQKIVVEKALAGELVGKDQVERQVSDRTAQLQDHARAVERQAQEHVAAVTARVVELENRPRVVVPDFKEAV